MCELGIFLQNAYDSAKKYPSVEDGYLRSKWEKFVDRACSEISKVDYYPEQELLFTGIISPGCHICRSGKWDCFFLTPHCNLNCGFCYSPNTPKRNFSGSNIGEDFANNMTHYQKLGIGGVSFSGGEALLEKDRLLTSLSNLGKSVDHIWLYTNGLLLNESFLTDLVDAGLDEVRFNAAATGYQHPTVLELMKKASLLFKWVTVEIPLISADEPVLLSSLSVWEEHGINTINLHEFIFEPGSNAEHFSGRKRSITLPDGHQTAIDPSSDTLALKVFKTVDLQKLNLGINYCSTAGKWRQITARREVLIPVSRELYETYLGEGVLESFFTVINDQAQAVPPDELEQYTTNFEDRPIYRLTRMAPLSLQEKQKNWLSFELIS